MRKKDMFSLGNLYGGMLDSVKKGINESTGPGGKSITDDDAVELGEGGPTQKSGFKEALNDEEDEESEKEHDSDCDCEECDGEKTVKESKKVAKQTLNTFMKNQSTFDRLYSKVIKENWGIEDAEDDIGALGLGDATPDSDLDNDFGGGDEGGDDFGGEGDEVTISIDKATAQTLIDLLQAAIGGGDEGGEDDFGGEGDIEGGDEGGLDFGGPDEDNEEMDFEEDEETYGTKTNAPDKKKVYQSKNNKVGGKVKPSGKKASSDVTDKVGDDGDFGHAITSPKKVNDGKQNKVGNLNKGQDFFKN